MKVTADTITDAQIRELSDLNEHESDIGDYANLDELKRRALKQARCYDGGACPSCGFYFYGAAHASALCHDAGRTAARRRCAEILNARAESSR